MSILDLFTKTNILLISKMLVFNFNKLPHLGYSRQSKNGLQSF